MAIKVEKDLCICCGACERLYPECFRLDDECKAEVIENASEEEAEKAIAVCPTEAIIIQE